MDSNVRDNRMMAVCPWILTKTWWEKMSYEIKMNPWFRKQVESLPAAHQIILKERLKRLRYDAEEGMKMETPIYSADMDRENLFDPKNIEKYRIIYGIQKHENRPYIFLINLETHYTPAST